MGADMNVENMSVEKDHGLLIDHSFPSFFSGT